MKTTFAGQDFFCKSVTFTNTNTLDIQDLPRSNTWYLQDMGAGHTKIAVVLAFTGPYWRQNRANFVAMCQKNNQNARQLVLPDGVFEVFFADSSITFDSAVQNYCEVAINFVVAPPTIVAPRVNAAVVLQQKIQNAITQAATTTADDIARKKNSKTGVLPSEYLQELTNQITLVTQDLQGAVALVSAQNEAFAKSATAIAGLKNSAASLVLAPQSLLQSIGDSVGVIVGLVSKNPTDVLAQFINTPAYPFAKTESALGAGQQLQHVFCVCKIIYCSLLALKKTELTQQFAKEMQDIVRAKILQMINVSDIVVGASLLEVVGAFDIACNERMALLAFAKKSTTTKTTNIVTAGFAFGNNIPNCIVLNPHLHKKMFAIPAGEVVYYT